MTAVIFPTLTSSSSSQALEDVHIIPEDCRYDTIKQEPNACYELKDKSLLEAFYEVDHRKDTSAHYLYVLFYFTFISLPVSIVTALVDLANPDQPYPMARILTSGTCCLALISMLSVGYLSYLRPKSLFDRISAKMQFRLNAFMVVAIQYAFLIVFIRRVFDFNCYLEIPGELKHMAGGICYPSALGRDQILAINSLALFIVPVLAYTSLKNVPITVVWSVMTVCIVIVLISAVALDAMRAIPIVLIWWFMGFFFIRDYHLKNVLIFLTNRQLKHQIIENKRISDETHATEMRHLIANVAHDLKTPLTSFNTGVEYIQLSIDTHLKNMKSQQLRPECTKELVSGIQSCLHNIRNTNSFMLMTINRCIDYTKASKGLKLVPRYETIDLMETLQLPLSCMQNIQNRIEIRLKEVSDEICSHIITDKQWLQENVLCLLSNAVKYSSEGVVSISVQLTTSPRRNLDVPMLPYHSSISPVENKHIPEPSFAAEPSTSDGPSFPSFSHFRNSVLRNTGSVKDLSSKCFLCFEVEDTGIGMADEAMETLFSPFKQTQRLAGGTGLGLYSLAKRVEALSGEYGVQKRRDGKQGSLFWFTIPYKADKATAAIMAQGVKYNWANLVTRSVSSTMGQDTEFDTMRTNEESIADAASVAATVVPTMTITSAEEHATKSPKDCWEILIVDDAPSIIKMTTMMLKKLGHKISSAENGEIAVRKVTNLWETSQQQYDVILMDLQMPVLDGLEATRRIRAWESNLSKTKQFIIGVSANSDPDTLAAAEIAGVDTFMAKPFDVTTFYERLKQCRNIGDS